MPRDFQTSAIKPKWTTCDRVVDISDNYIDEIDPENQQGAAVAGYLMTDTQGFMFLEGIRVEVDGEEFYYDRQSAHTLLGQDAVHRIEQYEMEAA